MAYGKKARARDDIFKVGDIVFVAAHTGDADYLGVAREPWRTNVSLEPRLSGWLGVTNNVAQSALGLGRIVYVDSSTDDVRYVDVPDSKIPAALQALGYPELTP